MNNAIFPFRQPFRDKNGDVVVKKSETTIFKVTTIQVVENNRDYKPEELTPISNEEYRPRLSVRSRIAVRRFFERKIKPQAGKALPQPHTAGYD